MATERKNPPLEVKYSCFIRDADAKVGAGEADMVLLVYFLWFFSAQ